MLSGLGGGLRARLLVSSGLLLRECVALAGARVLHHLEAPVTHLSDSQHIYVGAPSWREVWVSSQPLSEAKIFGPVA